MGKEPSDPVKNIKIKIVNWHKEENITWLQAAFPALQCGRKSSYSNSLPTLQPSLARAAIKPDLINETLPELAGIWRGDLGKRQVLQEVAGLIQTLATFPLNQHENN